jgi:hypothetical protein
MLNEASAVVNADSRLETDLESPELAIDSAMLHGLRMGDPAFDLEYKAATTHFAKAEAVVVALAVSILDPKDMLRKYASLGSEGLKLAKRRKASLPAGSWKGTGKQNDYTKVCDDLGLLIRSRVPIKCVEMDKYVRVHLWVEAVRPLVPNVEKLSYYQVSAKFLPTLVFDGDDLTGELKKNWIGFVTSAVTRQLSKEPMSMRELDAEIEAEKAKIEAESLRRRKPITAEEEVAAADKAADKKRRVEKNNASIRVQEALDDAIDNGHMTEIDVLMVAQKACQDHKLELPKSGLDVKALTRNDLFAIVDGLMVAERLDDMKAMHKRLTMILEMTDNAIAMMKVAS